MGIEEAKRDLYFLMVINSRRTNIGYKARMWDVRFLQNCLKPANIHGEDSLPDGTNWGDFF